MNGAGLAVGWWMAADDGAILRGQFPFPVRFKGPLNIFVAAAGLRLLLCCFCAVSLPVGSIPVTAPAGRLMP